MKVTAAQENGQAAVANGRPAEVVGDRALRAGPILDEENE